MSADLTTTISRGAGSSGAPISDSRPAGMGPTPLTTTEQVVLGGGGADRRIDSIFVTNVSGAAAAVTIWQKPILQSTGLPDAAAVKYVIAYQAAIAAGATTPTDLLPAGSYLVVPRDCVLSAQLTTGANNAVNMTLGGIVAR